MRPSFLEGMARIFDFAGALSTRQPPPCERLSAADAIARDWAAVGDDLWRACRAAGLGYHVWQPNTTVTVRQPWTVSGPRTVRQR